MSSLDEFAPNLLGPASKCDPFAKAPHSEHEEDKDLDIECDGTADADNAQTSSPRVNARSCKGLLPDEGFASEVLIGMPGETDNHPLQKLAVFSEKVRLAVEYGNQLQRTAERNMQGIEGASPAEGVGLAALAAETREQHRDVCVQPPDEQN